ncbi:MAG TPA: peptidylprolyl isomerase, partial [Fimbriimonas sp.]|nr:peptidylprolyl isomerase [Fimbriimonas sp.]
MSISNFQEKVLKGGCGKALIVSLGIVMIVGMGMNSQCAKGNPLGATDIKGNPAQTVASVGSVNLPLSLLETAVAEQQQQLPPDIMASLPAEYQLSSVAGSLNQIIQAGHVYEYATRNGFKNDDAYVLEASHLKSEAEFKAYAKEALTKAGMLKPNATEADFDKIIKEQTQGKGFSELYKAQFEDLSKALKDPQKRMVAVMSVAQRSALEQIQKSVKPTEADVRKSYERFNVKRVFVNTNDKVTDAQAKEKADKAYAELKAGKSFESVMDTYSDDTPDQGKKKSDKVLPLDQNMIDKVPDYAIIGKLQAGSYSEPVKVTAG